MRVDRTLNAGWATYERLSEQDLSQLARVDLGVLSVGSLRAEVNSGGFDQYFLNSGGDLAEYVVRWVRYRRPELAELVERAIQALGEPFPESRPERQGRLLALPTGTFETLDQEYQMIEVAADLDDLMNDLAETRFWVQFRDRIVTELRESGRPDLQGFWCDGLSPTRFGFAEDPPRLAGEMQLGISGQEWWTFELFPPVDALERAFDQRDWDPLLPLVETTGWLAANPTTRTLRIDVTKAEPVGPRVEIHRKTGRVKPLKR